MTRSTSPTSSGSSAEVADIELHESFGAGGAAEVEDRLRLAGAGGAGPPGAIRRP
jgi:hypothetical protein